MLLTWRGTCRTNSALFYAKSERAGLRLSSNTWALSRYDGQWSGSPIACRSPSLSRHYWYHPRWLCWLGWVLLWPAFLYLDSLVMSSLRFSVSCWLYLCGFEVACKQRDFHFDPRSKRQKS